MVSWTACAEAMPEGSKAAFVFSQWGQSNSRQADGPAASRISFRTMTRLQLLHARMCLEDMVLRVLGRWVLTQGSVTKILAPEWRLYAPRHKASIKHQ